MCEWDWENEWKNDFEHVDEQKTILPLTQSTIFSDIIPLYPIHSLLKRYKIQFSDEVSLRQIPNKEIINLTSPSVRLFAPSKSLRIFFSTFLPVIFHTPKPRLLLPLWKTAYHIFFVCLGWKLLLSFRLESLPSPSPPIYTKYTKPYTYFNKLYLLVCVCTYNLVKGKK